MGKMIKDTIHAKGIEIGIYTNNFENEFISLTDIAKYRNEDEPSAHSVRNRSSGLSGSHHCVVKIPSRCATSPSKFCLTLAQTRQPSTSISDWMEH